MTFLSNGLGPATESRSSDVSYEFLYDSLDRLKWAKRTAAARHFLARPDAVLGGKGEDPSFELIEACLYRYGSKGDEAGTDGRF